MENEMPSTVNWDFDDQRYYLHPSSIVPEGTTEILIEFARDVFLSLADNERIPAGVIQDLNKIELKFAASDLIALRAPDEFDKDSSAGQFWKIKNLARGLNVLKFQICAPTNTSNENAVAPSTSDEWIVAVSLPIIVLDNSLSTEQVGVLIRSTKALPSFQLQACLRTSFAAYSGVIAEGSDGQTVEHELRKLLELKRGSEAESRANYAIWGMTKEFVSQDAGIALSEDDWLCLAPNIQDLCHYYVSDQLSQSYEFAIDEHPGLDENDVSDFTHPEVHYSFKPESDSLPVYFAISRRFTEEQHGPLTNQQWAFVQSSILKEVSRYVLRDLPQLISKLEHSNCSHLPLEVKGL